MALQTGLSQQNREDPDSVSPLLLYASLVSAVLILYLRTVTFDFAYDDWVRVVQDPLATAPAFSLGNAIAIFTTPVYPGDLFRPFSTFTFWLNHLLTGREPGWYHATNVALHALCVMAVFRLITVTGFSTLTAFFTALLFAVHPVNVESVANVSGRPEILAALFGISSLFAFFHAVSAEITPRKAAWSALSAGLFFIATLSKESAFVFVFLIPLAVFYTSQVSVRKFVTPFLPVVAAAGLSLLLRQHALGPELIPSKAYFCVAENPLSYDGISFTGRLFGALRILGEYTLQLLVPVGLSADYSAACPDFFAATWSPGGITSAFLFLGWLCMAFGLRRDPGALMAFWYPIAFLLTSNIITPIGTIKADRLCYLPGIGFFGFLLLLLLESKKLRGGLALTCACAVLAAFCFLSWTRIPVWEDHKSLFLKTLQDAPQSPKILENAGTFYLLEMKNPKQAEEYFRRAFELEPTRIGAIRRLIDIYKDRRDYARTEFWCKQALKLEPDDEKVRGVLSTLMEMKAAAKKALPESSLNP